MDNIRYFAKKSKVKVNDILDIIGNYVKLKWIVPYKGKDKIFNIEGINEYLKDDPLKFDIEEGRLIAYTIEY